MSNKSRSKFVMVPHPLTNFQIQKYYQNKPKCNVFNQEIVCIKQRMGHI